MLEEKDGIKLHKQYTINDSLDELEDASDIYTQVMFKNTFKNFGKIFRYFLEKDNPDMVKSLSFIDDQECEDIYETLFDNFTDKIVNPPYLKNLKK